MLKGQDIVILAAIMADQRQGESYAELAERACLSASEAHAAVRRMLPYGVCAKLPCWVRIAA